jgi:hypothetical protein
MRVVTTAFGGLAAAGLIAVFSAACNRSLTLVVSARSASRVAISAR